MSNYQSPKATDYHPYVSVVVCVRNEAGNIAPLIQQVTQAMLSHPYELIYVNDGSTDQTLSELRSQIHPRLHIIDLQQNYGQSSALMAGIDAARGTFIVTMDGDRQNDPADIPAMLTLAEQGDYDLVAGIRADRQDGVLLRKLPSYVANRLICHTTGLNMKDFGCTLKVFRAELAKSLMLYGELHRFVAVLASFEGARMTQIPVRHHPRRIGQSKYGLNRIPKVASDLILLLFLKKYRQKPMHFFGGGGLFLLAMGALTGLCFLVNYFTSQTAAGISLLILSGILALGGMQLLAFGILAEMQMRAHYETQAKKTYRIRRVYGPLQTTL
ncbi:MAG: glycosyltransferase family 2 protein [Bacteroidetes bacterium]|nr:glycosyltransferase family 2 protein [Fibrella sp.]